MTAPITAWIAGIVVLASLLFLLVGFVYFLRDTWEDGNDGLFWTVLGLVLASLAVAIWASGTVLADWAGL